MRIQTTKRPAALICALAALALLACEKVPDYCGKGEWYDPSCQFCFANKAYNQCGGGGYNPLTEGCIQGAEVGARCADGSVVKLGTPCGGYALSTAATPAAGGGVARTPPDKARFDAGETAALNAVANDGYEFVGWAGADMSKSAAITVVMDADKPLVAMFRPLAPGALAASAFPASGGSVARAPDKDGYGLGEAVTVTAKANPGYTFSGWSGALASKNVSETITMDESKTLVALFTPVVHTLTVNVNPAGAGAVFVNGTALSGAAPQEFGARVELLAAAEDGYVFAGWTGAAEGMGSLAVIDIADADQVITANFRRGRAAPVDTSSRRRSYPVTVLIGETGASVGGDYAEGDTVAIAVERPPEGQRFTRWATVSGGVVFADENSAATTFVMPGGAVTVRAGFEGAGVVTPPGVNYIMFTDDRDGKQYKSVVIGGQTWMAENLNVETGNSWCYDDDEANCNVYGRLYDWETALTACPAGWKLPDTADWNRLDETVGDRSTAGAKLKATSGWNSYDGASGNGTDTYGFSALPGGIYYDSSFSAADDGGYWWTATEYSSDYAYFRGMYYGNDHVYESSYGKSDGFSVRCVKD